jgi:ankyrin repeat protein
MEVSEKTHIFTNRDCQRIETDFNGSQASATFQAARSGLTPIALAAREGREEVVADLIQRDVDTSVIDTLDRTPLFYACGTPIAGIVSRLVLENVPKNEGSLHEAASNLHVDHVVLLLAHGHDPEFPSPHHGGRSALGEVCMNANDILSPEGRNRLRKMIRLLLDHKVRCLGIT